MKGSLKAAISARPGSLTPLRFGYRYRLRARGVDLAGNDIATQPPNDFTSATPEFIYRRFEPVNTPALVAREDLKKLPGETMDRLVIRSNYNTSADRQSQRHVAPPKTSEFMAETHGMFDGAQTPDKSSYSLIIARDQNLDTEAVHPEKQLKLPYLPDPLSHGAAFHALPGTTDTFTVGFDGNWPDSRPFRLAVVEGGDPPQWDQGERVLRVQLKKAQIATVKVSSHLDLNDPNKAELETLQAWKWLQMISPPPDPADALNGRLWILTPFRDLTLMHAVQQPLQEPVFNNANDPTPSPFHAERLRIGNTFAPVGGRIYFDRESTGKLELQAQWTDPDDDPLLDAPQMLDRMAHVFEENIKYPQLGENEPNGPQPVQGGWVLPFESRHEFGDTKYRKVKYYSVATTRFREQFNFTDEEIKQGKSITRGTPEAARQVRDILSSARPDAPQVRYIIPMFGWAPRRKTKNKKEKTESISRLRKGGGLRIYLERPWYSSGDGELLGVVLWPGAASHLRGSTLAQAGAAVGLTSLPAEIPSELKPYISQWGMDPLWRSNALDVPLLSQHFLNGFSDGSIDPQRKYTLEEFSQDTPYKPERLVSVVALKPEFDQERKLWYCDVEMDTQEAYYPFVRFALVRFQPNSVIERAQGVEVPRECHLSRVVLAEFVQLAPDRTASIILNSKNKKIAHVDIRGVTFEKSDAGDSGSEIELTLEVRNRRVASGWLPMPESVTHLTPELTANAKEAVWSGDVKLPKDFDDEDYRLVIREYERFRADSSLNERRLIYADVLEF